MRRGLAESGRGAVQAVALGLWLLCALAAVAAPAKKHGKAHAVHAQAEGGGKSSKAKPQKPAAKPHGKAAPKSPARSKSRHHKPKVDEADFEPPTVHRTRATVSPKPVGGVRAAGSLPAMPPTNGQPTAKSYAGTATGTAALPLPPQYSPVEADDDAPEVSDAALNQAAAMPAAPLKPAPATRSELAEEAVQPVVIPGLYSRTGRLLVPAALKGSREVLVHQNTMADAAGLSRIEDEDDLARLRRLHLLVDLPESAALRVNPQLNQDRRCARPWTVKFVTETARAFHAKFGVALQLNSAVRTVAYQRRLQRTNGNAAATEGETASPHLTGQAIDFGKRGMSLAQIAWMRAYLLPLMQAGKIDVEEEFQQACFHISVYKSYVPVRRVPPKTQMALARPPRVSRSGE